ncbi:MAG: hypothetical protein GF347_01760 [Candidatus Moranbacteria bacterium]|nr:hypothetical protein [Candidatus Moranbacteria bacterium]
MARIKNLEKKMNLKQVNRFISIGELLDFLSDKKILKDQALNNKLEELSRMMNELEKE